MNSRIIGAASLIPPSSVSRQVWTVSNFSASSALVIHIQVVNKATSSVGNWSFRYKSCFVQVDSIRTQAMKLHKNFVRFKYSLRKEKSLDENSSLFKPRK